MLMEDPNRPYSGQPTFSSHWRLARRIWSDKIDPRLPKNKKEAADYTGSVAIIDACRPYHWIDEFPATTQIAEELLKETNAKWGKALGED